MGFLLSWLDFLGVTPFEGAIFCVCACVIGTFVFWAFIWEHVSVSPWLIDDDEAEDDDELDEVRQPQRSQPSKRRRRSGALAC